MTSSKTTKPKHTHKLKRHRFGTGNSIYFCTLPDCSYKIKQPLALGKESLCNRCGEPFIMNEYSIRLAKPHCADCHKSKEGKDNGIHVSDDNPIIFHPPTSLADRMKQVSQGQPSHNVSHDLQEEGEEL